MEEGTVPYHKMPLVMNDVGLVAKRGRNNVHKYYYSTKANIVLEIRELLLEHGIVVQFSVHSNGMKHDGDFTFQPINFTKVDTEMGLSDTSTVI